MQINFVFFNLYFKFHGKFSLKKRRAIDEVSELKYTENQCV